MGVTCTILGDHGHKKKILVTSKGFLNRWGKGFTGPKISPMIKRLVHPLWLAVNPYKLL